MPDMNTETPQPEDFASPTGAPSPSTVPHALWNERELEAPTGDIDVFHDREERVAATVLNDTQALTTAGYAVSWLRQLPLIYTAEVALDQAEAFVARMPTDKL